MTRPSIHILFLSLIATFATEAIAIKPLSCDVQLLLNGTTALARDQGRSEADAKRALTDAGDLTKNEIQSILRNVYTAGKGKTPDQIKDAAYQRCKRVQ